jgi:hypothetical protein
MEIYNSNQGDPVKFDWDYYYYLVNEEGISEAHAMNIVATEMEGAYENEDGGIDSYATYCNELDYDEALPSREDLPDTHPADEWDGF